MARGFLVPDPRIRLETYDSTNSTLTEASPQPCGLAAPSSGLSRLRLSVSGQQAEGEVLVVSQAGWPRLGPGAARVSVRHASEAATALRGWEAPNHLIDYATLIGIDAAITAAVAPSSVLIPPTQQLAVAWVDTTGTVTVNCSIWSPNTQTFGAPVAVCTLAHATAVVGITRIPESGRLIIVAASSSDLNGYTYYSDDTGATWSLAALSPFSTALTTAPTRAALLYVGGDLVWCSLNNGPVAQQYASASLGASFDVVVASNAQKGVDACVLPSGKVAVLEIRSTDDKPYVHVIGSAFEPLTNDTGTNISAITVGEGAICCDQDGRLYVFARGLAAGTIPRIYGWFSDDEGVTWKVFDYHPLSTWDADTKYINRLHLTASAGCLLLLHGGVSGGATKNTTGMNAAVFAGWSQWVMTKETGGVGTDPDQNAIGFGYTAIAARTVRNYVPLELASQLTGAAWTAVASGTPTTEALPAGDSRYQAASGVVGRYRYFTVAGAAGQRGMLWAAKVAVPGGANLIKIGSIIAENGATDEKLSISASATQISITDGTTTWAANVDMTLPMHIRVGLDAGHAYAAYRRPYESTWTELVDASVANSGALVAASIAAWGYGVDGGAGVPVGTVDWYYVGIWIGSTTAWWATKAESTASRQDIIGKVLTARPYPLPLSSAMTSSPPRYAFVSSFAGPAYEDEVHTAALDAAYPARHVMWDVAPSPSRVWRSSSDAADVRIAWSPSGYVTHLGTSSPAIYVDNCTFRSAKLQGKTGGGAWTDIVDIDLATGFLALGYSVTGDTVIPDGAAVGARYIQRNEFVGGTIHFYDAAHHVYARILSNTEGTWRSGGGKAATFVVDIATKVGATWPHTAPMACEIWAPRGAAIAHDQATTYDRFALFIPAAATATATGYFQVGTCLIGSYHPVGHQWQWGWIREWAQNCVESRDARGSRRKRQSGPVLPSIQVSWPTPIDQTGLQAVNPDPDWYSSAVGAEPLVSYADAPFYLAGLLDWLEAGSVPVVWLGNVSGTGGLTITDPTILLYGYLDSPIITENVVGNEGSTEANRVQSILIQGIR